MELESWNTSLTKNYEVTRKDLIKNKVLTNGAWLSPILIPTVPSLIFLIAGLFTTPFFLALSFVWLIGGFILGLIVSGGLLIYRQRWLAQIRERIAVDGIKTEEVQWFQHELTTAERKALKEIEREDRLLGDAYRETLASRLTATRITKATKNELLLVKKRQSKLKTLKTQGAEELKKVLQDDLQSLEKIKTEAEQMKMEAETRLQLIEAASRRGTSFVDSELALKKLSLRASELPLALEALKMEEEVRKELESQEDKLLNEPN